MFEMKKNYYLGIDLIDGEHEGLFQIANEAYTVYHDEFIADKFDHIVAIIERLRDYTKMHFEDEERYMESIGYRKILSHKVLHADFIEKIDAMEFEDMDRNQTETLVELIEFLGDWLIHHILEQDMQFVIQK